MTRTLTILALSAAVSFTAAPAFAATTLAGGPSTRMHGATNKGMMMRTHRHHMMMKGHGSMMKGHGSMMKSGRTDQGTGTTLAGGQKAGSN